MAEQKEQSWSKLKKAKNYRSFLQIYVQEGSLSLSALSQSAGFGRSYIGDIVSGRRRVTEKSCHAIEKAMKRLPLKGKKLFRFLVAKEEDDLFPLIKRDQLKKNIKILREDTWERKRKTALLKKHDPLEIFQNPFVGPIMASLNSKEKGKSLAQIKKLTGRSEQELIFLLKKLQKVNWVEEKDGHYRLPSHDHYFLESENTNQLLGLFLNQAFQRSEMRLNKRNVKTNDFFFSSYITVSEKKWLELRNQFKDIIVNFLDESIDEEDDDLILVQLATSFHPIK